MNDKETNPETFDELWRRLKPITEGSTPKVIAELFFIRGIQIGEDSEMRSAPYAKAMGSVSERGARAL